MTRADVIYNILEKTPGQRLAAEDIRKKLAVLEGVDISSYPHATVNATVRGDNKTKKLHGQTPRFKHFGDNNETRGYISLYGATTGLPLPNDRQNDTVAIETPQPLDLVKDDMNQNTRISNSLAKEKKKPTKTKSPKSRSKPRRGKSFFETVLTVIARGVIKGLLKK